MSKPCKSNQNDLKIIRLLYENKEGLRTKSIQKWANLKERVVYKRLEILKERKLVENIYPIWRICHSQYDFCATLISSSNIFELHNLSYVVKLIKTPDWWSKRKNYLIKLKEYQFKQVDYGNGGMNPYQQLTNDNFVIQAYPESLIIISRKRYYSNQPYETIQKAMGDVLDLLDWFCQRFRFNFFAEGVPHIEVRNNDFNRMNDSIANTIKKEKGKFLVEIDSRRKVWVDKSEPFGKESNYPEAQEKLEKVTKDLLTKDCLLPSEVTALVGELAKNQLNQSNQISEFAIALNKHIPAYEGMANVVGELKEEIRSLKEEIKKLKQ